MNAHPRLSSPAWCIAAVLFTLAFVGYFRLRFGEPLAISGDHVFHLKMLREGQGSIRRFNLQMGAPWRSDALYFPLFDFTYKVLAWVASHLSSNVFRADARFYGMCLSLTVVTAFWAFRALTLPAWLAAAGAVVFVASPFFAMRSLGHDYLALYLSVPLGAALPLLLAMAAPGAPAWRCARTPAWVAGTLLAGCSGFYYGVYAGIFLVLGSGMTAAARRDWRPLALGCATSAVVVLLLLVTTYGPDTPKLLLGGIPAPPQRSPLEQFFHGLLLSDAMLEFRHFGLWENKFSEYLQALQGPGFSELGGESYLVEWPGPLLTATILACLIAAPVLAFAGWAQRGPRAAAVTMAATLVAFGVVFSLRGGLGYVFVFGVMSALRAQERVLPFLSFFALAGLGIGVDSLIALRPRFGAAVAAALGAGLAVGLAPAYQILPAKQAGSLAVPAVGADLRSIPAMLAAKDAAHLGMILTLPVMPWPPNGPELGFDGTRNLLPYLMDRRNSPTRWSYGLDGSQPEFARLQSDMQLDAPDLVDRAKAAGYDGILIERKAVTPEDSAALDRQVDAGGCATLYADDVLRLCKVP